MFVLTVDQKGSRKGEDLVPGMIQSLSDLWVGWPQSGPLLPFARTVGDEFQGLLTKPQNVIAVTRYITRQGGWYVGIGLGSVSEPLPAVTSAASGEAFIHAREAVEDAKVLRGNVPISVRSNRTHSAAHAQALLRLLGLTWQGRSTLAWEALDLLVDPFGRPTGMTQREVADQLGVSSAAISKRLKSAAYDEERAIYPLLYKLLEEADGD